MASEQDNIILDDERPEQDMSPQRHETAPEKMENKSTSDEKKLGLHSDIERTISIIDDENDGDYDVRKENRFGEVTVIDNAKDLITHVLHVDDNPNDTPWTFRAMLIGKFYDQVVIKSQISMV